MPYKTSANKLFLSGVQGQPKVPGRMLLQNSSHSICVRWSEERESETISRGLLVSPEAPLGQESALAVAKKEIEPNHIQSK